MTLDQLLALFGAAASSGLGGWVLRLYGQQREHTGRIAVLETNLHRSAEDHDKVVRLEERLGSLTRAVEEVNQGQKEIHEELKPILAVVQEIRAQRT